LLHFYGELQAQKTGALSFNAPVFMGLLRWHKKSCKRNLQITA
jgi:hypothetical protein